MRIFNRINILILLSALGLSLFQTLAIYSLFKFEIFIALVDSLIHTTLYTLTSIPLYNSIKFGKFEKLPNPIRTVNYLTLLILGVATVNGLGHWIESQILNTLQLQQIYGYLPSRILISILIFTCIYHLFKKELTEYSMSDPKQEALENREKIEFVSIKTNSKLELIPVEDIICIESNGDYVTIYTLHSKHIKEQTMKFYDENLNQKQFHRVHRSYIVNLTAIARVELYSKTDQQLTLLNGMKIKISQNGYKSLKEKLKL